MHWEEDLNSVLHKFVSNNLKWFESSTFTEKGHLRFEKRNTKNEEFHCRTFATINWRGPLSNHDTYPTSEEDSGGGESRKLPYLSLLQRRRTPTKTTATSDENRGTVSGRSGFLSQFVKVNPILRILPPLSLSLSLSLRLSFVHCGVAIFCSAFFTPITGGTTQLQAASLPYCGTIITLLLFFRIGMPLLLVFRFPPPLLGRFSDKDIFCFKFASQLWLHIMPSSLWMYVSYVYMGVSGFWNRLVLLSWSDREFRVYFRLCVFSTLHVLRRSRRSCKNLCYV